MLGRPLNRSHIERAINYAIKLIEPIEAAVTARGREGERRKKMYMNSRHN